MINEDLLGMFLTVARYQLTQVQAANNGMPLTPQQIEAVVHAVPTSLIASISSDAEREAFLKEAARRLELQQRVQIADPTVLRASRTEWYVRDRKAHRPFWRRYQNLLKFQQHFDDKTVAAVDKGSDAVLAGLGDPRESGPFDARGIVVGQVQSGKTTSYSAVINKAIDAGYRVIIVLTGLHEGLRAQTQKRIEEGVRGLATDSGDPTAAKKDQPLPLLTHGEVPIIPAMLTTRASDFSASAQHFATLSGTAPVILVIKKNATILRHVQEFFAKSHVKRVHDPVTGREEIDSLPLLLIDDEADAASVNTNIRRRRKDDDDTNPSTINREIRRLLLMFRQRSYVAYTATPYANILIHKDHVTATEGPDLFPRDFVVMLPAPSNYVGPGVFFGQGVAEEDEEPLTRPRLIRIIDDCSTDTDPLSGWMPSLHKKDHQPRIQGEEDIPSSLKDALVTFLLATTVRRLRGHQNAHNSMLVHVSRYKDVQKRVLDQVVVFLYEMKGILEGVTSSPNLVSRLEKVWADFADTETTLDPDDRGLLPAWSEVRHALLETMDIVQAKVINSSETGGLNYDANKNGLNVIAIGGDKLSRGLTLEGLTVSYFLRATKMYDTLLQMGRWFGYRPGYKDLCRLFVTRDIAEHYSHITKADEELRAEFAKMQDQNPPLRPEDYGLRVRSHPTLLITSPLKMAAGEVLTADFGGRVSQTIHFFKDTQKLQHNLDAAAALLKGIADHRVDLPLGRGGALYRDVACGTVEAFFRSYLFHPRSRGLAPEKLLNYLTNAWKAGVARNWTVHLASGGQQPVTVGSVATRAVGRGLTADGDPATIEIGVLSSPGDLVVDLEPDPTLMQELALRGAEAERKARLSACERRPESSALLVLYVAQPMSGAGKNKKPAPPAADPMPLGFAVALPRSNKVDLPEYVVNSVFFDAIEEQLIAIEEAEAT
jgi:hypothetical protein